MASNSPGPAKDGQQPQQQRNFISDRPAKDLVKIKDQLFQEAHQIMERLANEKDAETKKSVSLQSQDYFTSEFSKWTKDTPNSGKCVELSGQGRKPASASLNDIETVKTQITDKVTQDKVIAQQMVTDGKGIKEKIEKAYEAMVTSREALRGESEEMRRDRDHIRLMRNSMEDEREALLKRGKLAEKLCGVEVPDGSDVEWLYMQLRAYVKEIEIQRAKLEKTVLRIEEQTELCIESEFTKQELEYSDILGKRTSLEELERKTVQKSTEVTAVQIQVENLSYNLKELTRSKETAEEKERQLREWTARNRNNKKMERGHEKLVKTQAELQSLIDVVVPWMVILKRQQQAYEREGKEYIETVGQIQKLSSVSTRKMLEHLRDQLQSTLLEVISEASQMIEYLPKPGTAEAQAFEQFLDFNLPEKVLEKIDQERARIDHQRSNLDKDLDEAQKFLSKIRNEGKDQLGAMLGMQKKAMRGIRVKVLLDNVLMDRRISAGPEHAIWIPIDRLGKTPTPEIYMDDILSMSWGPTCEMVQERPGCTLPWRCFTLKVFRNHSETEEEHVLTRADAGKKIKGSRISLWHFQCHNDDDAQFWIVYLSYMCDHLEKIKPSEFQKARAQMKINGFCATQGITPARMWRRAIMRVIAERYTQRAPDEDVTTRSKFGNYTIEETDARMSNQYKKTLNNMSVDEKIKDIHNKQAVMIKERQKILAESKKGTFLGYTTDQLNMFGDTIERVDGWLQAKQSGEATMLEKEKALEDGSKKVDQFVEDYNLNHLLQFARMEREGGRD